MQRLQLLFTHPLPREPVVFARLWFDPSLASACIRVQILSFLYFPPASHPAGQNCDLWALSVASAHFASLLSRVCRFPPQVLPAPLVTFRIIAGILHNMPWRANRARIWVEEDGLRTSLPAFRSGEISASVGVSQTLHDALQPIPEDFDSSMDRFRGTSLPDSGPDMDETSHLLRESHVSDSVAIPSAEFRSIIRSAHLSHSNRASFQLPWESSCFSDIFDIQEDDILSMPPLSNFQVLPSDVEEDPGPDLVAESVGVISEQSVFSQSVSDIADVDFHDRREQLLHVACDKWASIIRQFPGCSDVGMHLYSLGSGEIDLKVARVVITAVLGVKSSSTAISRANMILRFLDWFDLVTVGPFLSLRCGVTSSICSVMVHQPRKLALCRPLDMQNISLASKILTPSWRVEESSV